MDFPDHATFAAHKGPGWSLETPAGETVEVVLLEVDTLPSAEGAAGREPFSLEFHVRADELPQGTYRFEHAVLGRLSLFVVPIGSDDEGLRLQAVFS